MMPEETFDYGKKQAMLRLDEVVRLCGEIMELGQIAGGGSRRNRLSHSIGTGFFNCSRGR